MKIEAVIFDMDGVIFDTERLYLDVWKTEFSNCGYTLEDDVYFSVMGKGRKKVKEIYKKIFGENLKVDDMYRRKDESLNKRIYQEENLLKDGVIEVLEYLKVNNFKIGLATSAKKDRVIRQLNDYRIFDYFNFIITGDDVNNSKPNPEIFLKAMSGLNVNPKNSIIIEDSVAGVEAGIKSGASVVHIKDLVKVDEENIIALKSLFEFRDYLVGCAILEIKDLVNEESDYFELGDMSGFEKELKRELSKEHDLYGKKAVAILKSSSCDDVIYYIEGVGFVIIHLTYSKEINSSYPRYEIYSLNKLKEYV